MMRIGSLLKLLRGQKRASIHPPARHYCRAVLPLTPTKQRPENFQLDNYPHPKKHACKTMFVLDIMTLIFYYVVAIINTLKYKFSNPNQDENIHLKVRRFANASL
jgi:hypothetical protein